MFSRKDQTYDFDERCISYILQDPANPVNRIAELIHNGAKVLDIGAGNGILPRVIAAKSKDVVIDGIEPNVYAAESAKGYYRNFFTGYAQEFVNENPLEEYDYIILADVIEHIVDPYEFLKTLVNDLDVKTKIILSVPNVAFGAVRRDLFDGNFNYVNSGILEKTHLRFFTKKSIEEIINRLGLYIIQMYHLKKNIFYTETPIKKDFFSASLLFDKNSSTYQYLIVVSKLYSACQICQYGQKANLLDDLIIYPIKSLIKRIFKR
jgi:2-polyprenyl-3-methyl-5-hydroxy-6-metoxy-1,4-benzoquinol methylase